MKYTLQTLISMGHLKDRDVLTLNRRGKLKQFARVNADGNLITDDGKVHRTLSGAARHYLGRAVDGWTAWRLENGEYIDSLRRTPDTQVKSE